MAKSVKKRGKGDHKRKQVPSPCNNESAQLGSTDFDSPTGDIGNHKGRELCPHIDRGIILDKLSARLGSSISHKCEDCVGTIGDRRLKKGKGKSGKKGGNAPNSESNATWVCLGCGHFSCGGVGLPTLPQSHAVRHARQNRHPLVVHHENHQLIWCFQCDKLIHAEKAEDNVNKDLLNQALRLLKDGPVVRLSADVEDIWFGNGSTAISPDSSEMSADSGYSVRGLVNLGNTCFFNSIMQNLLALKKLRDYFLRLEESVGPITAALRKVFVETGNGSGLRGAIDPRSLFGCLCAKASQFKGYQQHDSHELLRCLLECISTEELSSRNVIKSSQGAITDYSFVDAIFGGKLSSTVSCLKCGHASTIYEPFLDLSLPVPTKKPPSKQVKPVPRGKKQKLPPRRSGKNLSRSNRPTHASLGERFSDKCTVVSNVPEVRSESQPEERSMVPSGDYAFTGSIDPVTIALDMGFTTDDLSGNNGPVNNQAASIGEPTLDGFSWLDYVGIDEASDEKNSSDVEDLSKQLLKLGSLTEMDHLEMSTHKDVVNGSLPPADDSLFLSLCHIAECSTRYAATSVQSNEPFSSLPCGNFASEDVPHPLEKKQNMLESYEGHFSGNSFAEEAAESDANAGHGAESSSEVLPEVLDVSVGALDNSAEVQDWSLSKSISSSVQNSETEVSAAMVGNGEDCLDFSGFGDLFNEPEFSLENTPFERPVSDASILTRTELTGDSSESEHNEVDNGDDSVSVESCIAYFIKPELLSKDEHSWECDNCSKVLQDQIVRSKKKVQLSVTDAVSNDNCTSSPQVVEEVNQQSSMNGNHDPDASDSSRGSLLSPDVEVEETREVLTGSPAKNALHGPSDSSSPNSQTCTLPHEDCDSDEDRLSKSRIQAPKCESDACDQDQELLNPENMKVKRDATKTILIDKAPSVLTIHLMRFSEDSRGRFRKLNGHVSFRETINLTPYMDPRYTEKGTLSYRLVGVVVHSGTMRTGHYIAYVRGTKNNGECVWYYASDAHVREASLEEVLRCEAYILFYETI